MASAGGGGGSPKYDNLVLSNLNSPRFDISDFLKTPTHGNGSPDDESLYNLQGFDMPMPSTPTFNNMMSACDDHGTARVADNAAHAQFGSFLYDDSKGAVDHVHGEGMGVMSSTCLDNADLISFDDIDAIMARGSFPLFNCNSDFENHHIGPFATTSTTTGNGWLPPLTIPSGGLYAAAPGAAYEAGGLFEVEERVLASLEHAAASTSAPTAPLYNTNHHQIDWGNIAPHHHHEGTGVLQPNVVQHTTLQCEHCQLLRRIIHSNGVQDTKLEIHGGDGQSYHAVLQTRFCIDDGFPSTLEQQMVDFPVGNSEYVKQFLLQYSMLRGKEGFILRHDSLQVPMNLASAMCIAPERVVGAGSAHRGPDFSSGAFSGKPAPESNTMHQSIHAESSDHVDPSVMPVKPPKSNAAAQRERTGKLKMSDLAQFFHLPINAAAKELGICPTVLKKICRRNGMRRWPHRKIKSIERIIATLEQTIAEGAGQGDESIRMEIAMLRNERAQLCAGLLGET